MPKSRRDGIRTLASSWSVPVSTPAGGEPGNALICIASTYTFHAPFFESELLPRFLGLKFDETEGIRPFVVEREERLATTRVCVLVDADHLDPSQSTLRWDQVPFAYREERSTPRLSCCCGRTAPASSCRRPT